MSTDANGGAVHEDGAMPDDDVTRLELELLRGVEPISGQIRIDDGPEREFIGVLELITLLDEARAPASDGASGTDG
jgi:hypothetical protein